jgi:tripartite-type tricarboxylate transporter receptor subunit TctC
MSTQSTTVVKKPVSEQEGASAITVVVPFPAGGIDLILKTFLSVWSKQVEQSPGRNGCSRHT